MLASHALADDLGVLVNEDLWLIASGIDTPARGVNHWRESATGLSQHLIIYIIINILLPYL